MNILEAQIQISELSHKINFYNNQYYQNNISYISDYEFDQLLNQLIKLENQFPELKSSDSPSQRVGGTITKNFENIIHKYPMLSLSNTYSSDDLDDFDQRVRKLITTDIDYVCEQKFDGVAISLIYENGLLTKAITRGDGIKGDNIIANAKTIRSIPLKINQKEIPSYFEVRGEVYFSYQSFDKINQEKISLGEPTLANPRNAASGTLKLQDSSEVARRKLDCYVYSLLGDDLPFSTHSESLQKLQNWGFAVSQTYQICKNIDEVKTYIDKWELARHQLPLATDGVVIKINQLKTQKDLGMTAKSPKWAVAYKYKAQSVSTVLETISYQVGRTGAITPVANLKPVLLAGTVVKRASLHNANEIDRLDLHENDTVFVEKGGEIIPKITSVDLSKRSINSNKVSYITHCPECSSLLIRNEDEANHYCPNEYGCKPQIKGKLEHFISRKAMNIDGIGPETIDTFYENGLLIDLSDLYYLDFNQITALGRFGEKSISNLKNGLQNSKAIPFEQVLYSLGIRHVGFTVAGKLAKHFKNIDQLSIATIEQLLEVDEIGEKIAISLTEYFKIEKNIINISRLKSAGLQFEIVEKELILDSNTLENQSFVISGVFEKFSRDELQEKIVANGGKILSGVSAKTSFLLAGENMGPSKLEKANKLGVKIISELEFLEMINH